MVTVAGKKYNRKNYLIRNNTFLQPFSRTPRSMLMKCDILICLGFYVKEFNILMGRNQILPIIVEIGVDWVLFILPTNSFPRMGESEHAWWSDRLSWLNWCLTVGKVMSSSHKATRPLFKWHHLWILNHPYLLHKRCSLLAFVWQKSSSLRAFIIVDGIIPDKHNAQRIEYFRILSSTLRLNVQNNDEYFHYICDCCPLNFYRNNNVGKGLMICQQ